MLTETITSKPRNARSKRALEKREPKAIENPKTCLFLRGTTCSQIVQDALNELYALRVPLAKKFSKKNPVHPFDDASSLEFFSEKNDASLLCFGSSQKKRPHNVTLVRTFGHKVLDMIELGLDAESFRTMAQFKTRKFAIGLRPMVLFAGTAFESPVENEYTLAKSMFLDFFKGDPSDKIDVEGLQYIVSISADEETSTSDPDVKPAIHLRVYLISRAMQLGVNVVDVLFPLLDTLSEQLGRKPSAIPGLLRQLDDEYFSRISAIEYTVRHDDGMALHDLDDRDIGRVRAACTHRRKRFVSRCIDERDHVARLGRYLVRTDVLGDPARFARGHIRFANRIEQ